MSNHAQAVDQTHRTGELLSAGAAAELHLLERERKAEKRLAKALAAFAENESKLHRAQERLERCREDVAAAEASLRESQALRAAGPHPGHD